MSNIILYRDIILTLLNIINSIGGIVGIVLFKTHNTIFHFYTLPGAYGFYWFVSVFSLLYGVIAIFYHSILKSPQSSITNPYVISLFNFIMFGFWTGAAIAVDIVLMNCFHIDTTSDINCNDEIIITAFGFSNVLVWFTALLFSCTNLYNKFVKSDI